jgi:peptidoglycan-associated lipoprotein
MRHLTRLLAVVAVASLALTMFGCPKKCVKPDEPIAPPPPPMETAEIIDQFEDMGAPVEPVEPGGEMGELGLQTIHFDFDMSAIRAGDGKKLEANAAALKQAADEGMKPAVSVEGHCDPVGTSEYNMALGLRRAEAAKAFLVKLGVPAGQLSCVSFGEERLVTQKEDEFELNRRVEFKTVEK